MEPEQFLVGPLCCRRPCLTHTPISSHTVDGWWGSLGSMQWGGGPPRSAPACPSEAKTGWWWRHWRSRRTWLSQCFQPFPGERGIAAAGRWWRHPPRCQVDRKTEVGPGMSSPGGEDGQGPTSPGSSSGGMLMPTAWSCWGPWAAGSLVLVPRRRSSIAVALSPASSSSSRCAPLSRTAGLRRIWGALNWCRLDPWPSSSWSSSVPSSPG